LEIPAPVRITIRPSLRMPAARLPSHGLKPAQAL